MSKETTPYVVSADVNRLMRIWAAENRLIVPSEQYFQQMLCDLEKVLAQFFDSVDIVPEKFLASGLRGMSAKSSLPVISLDRAYINENTKNIVGFIDITRTVDENLNSRGLSERPGTPPIEDQVNQIIRMLPTNKVALVDDVLFEGGTHATVASWLQERGVIVEKVLVGIAIREGAEKLAELGVDVHSLLSYDAVVDEVCERDFVAGAPLSGRTVVTKTGEIFGAPYFLPFGKPDKWASIPVEQVGDFSAFALAQSIALWTIIERLNSRSIDTREVPKSIFGLREDRSIVTALTRTNGKK